MLDIEKALFTRHGTKTKPTVSKSSVTDIDTPGILYPGSCSQTQKHLLFLERVEAIFPLPPFFPQWERLLGPLPKSPVVKSPSVPNYNPSSRFMALSLTGATSAGMIMNLRTSLGKILYCGN